MNYIKHLTCFFEIIYLDNRLNPNHVSLYMALFQFWNLNRFENPFKVIRYEVMQMSKIGSINTYHKCLHDLHHYGYIQYIPSFNPLQGSSIHLLKFDTSTDTALDSKSIQVLGSSRLKNDTGSDNGLESILKQYKHINNKTICVDQAQIQNEKSLKMKTEKLESNGEKTKRKKEDRNPAEGGIEINVRETAKVGEKNKIPPTLDQVKIFFKAQEYPDVEAQKFFNHFQSNGWRVGGKSPMKDWHAAARNWMLNFNKFHPPVKANSTNLNKNKNYGEPL